MTANLRSTPSSAISTALLEIQAPVRARLKDVPAEMWRIVAVDSAIGTTVNHHLMGMKGKMLRPTLVLLASEVAGGAEPRALAVAAVAELIHLATLVHDDSVDHSTLRRGMPTVNSLFSHQVSVIMGDFLYARSIAELVRMGDLELIRVFSEASNELTLGELRQLSAIEALTFSERDYEKLIGAKTAALFAASCEAGALCGARDWRSALGRYGERLGMAFQVADDLLDYTEAQETVGKPTGLDLREHKVTLPLIAALRKLSAGGRRPIEALFSTPEPTDALIAEVVTVVRDAGGLDYARRRGEEFAQEAEEAIAEIPESPAKAALLDAIAYVMERRG